MDITDEMVYLCRDDGDTATTLGSNGLVGGTAIKVHPWMVKVMLMSWLLSDDTEEGPALKGWYLSSYDTRADMPVQRAQGPPHDMFIFIHVYCIYIQPVQLSLLALLAWRYEVWCGDH